MSSPTSPYTSNGTIRQEDIHACNIARSAIARSLALEARHTALLVSSLISSILSNQAPLLPIDDLWSTIQGNAALRAIACQTDANVDDYSQFAGWVKGRRSHVAYAQKARLNAVFERRLYAQRFGNSVRLTRLHLVACRTPV